MSKGLTQASKLELPLVAEQWHGQETVPQQVPQHEHGEWHGWQALGDAPEPQEPQGEYDPARSQAVLELPAIRGEKSDRPVELLAPAGGMEAALAAFHFGADAVYLGLKKFSARAEAENFTAEEVEEITAYAHSLEPRRRVFVTVNTLLRQDELAEVVADVARLADIGVDAIILQDLGIYHLLRQYFPNLELHGSTQMSVHNRAGAETLQRLGFRRVVLARELTFEEVDEITATGGVETEVFIHGALCYAYSGLCLFSSQTLGRSGNRGKCAYSCRDSFQVTGAPDTLRDGESVRRDPRQGFPFSMKDLALPDHLPALRAAGVSCFKVEGRKKSPLYVATTTDYYRRLLDGTLDAEDRPAVEQDIQTVFSRPWTRLFVQSHKDKEVADRDTVGHRGTLIGKVERVIPASGATSAPREPRLRFRTARALQRHDGLQIDLPVLGKPFGFAVEHLWLIERGKASDVFEAPADALVEVSLPREHPELPAGAPVYCSSSQEVKQRYKYDHPKAGQYRQRRNLHVEARLTAAELTITGRVEGVGSLFPCPPAAEGSSTTAEHGKRLPTPFVEAVATLAGPFPTANEPNRMEQALRETFAKLGNTGFLLKALTFDNADARFVPVSRLNHVRRELTEKLERTLQQRLADRIRALQAEVEYHKPEAPAKEGAAHGVSGRRLLRARLLGGEGPLRFSLGAQGGLRRLPGCLHCGGFRGHRGCRRRNRPRSLAEFEKQVGRAAQKIGRDRLRLALPPLTRRWEDRGLRYKIGQLRDEGWQRWEAANLSAWSYLGLDPAWHGQETVPQQHPAPELWHGVPTVPRETPDAGAIDLTTDWSVYVLNRLAARQLLDMGVRRFTLSPEDGLANLRSLLAEFAALASVIVYQDTPLFLAESCAYANLIGGCPGKANCKFESMDMVSSHGERVTALDYHCRTIVLNQGPFCLSGQLRELARAGAVHLRADFVYRKYEPEQVRDLWQLVRAGKQVPHSHAANFHRGIL